MFAWLKNPFKKAPSETTVSLRVVQALCDVQRPMLRREDLERIDRTHSELQEDINSTRDQAKQIAARMSSELERAKMRVTLISDSLMDPLLSVDAHGIIVSTNQTAERILGFTSTDLVGQSVNFLISNSSHDYALLFREEAQKYINYVNKFRPTNIVEYRDLYRNYAMAEGNDFLNRTKEIRCATREGKSLPAEMYANILNVDSEEADNVIFLVVFRDTSEQVAAITEVESLTQFQMTLLSALPNPVFYKDSDMRIKGSNTAFDTFTGRPSATTIGKSNDDLFGRDLAAELNRIDAELKNTESPDIQIHKLDFKTAEMREVREVMLYCTALRSKEGAFKGILATLVDLTDLLSMKRFKEALLYSVPAPVYYLDRDLKYRDCNEKYSDLVGMRREDIVGHTREQVLTYDLQNSGILTEFYRQKDFEMLTSGQATQSYEAQVYNRITAVAKDVVVYRSVLRAADGKFDGIIAVVTDVSEIRTVQQFHNRIFDSSPLPLFYKDKNLAYVSCNSLYANWYMLDSQELVGKTNQQLIEYMRHNKRNNSMVSIDEIEAQLMAIETELGDNALKYATKESAMDVFERQVWNFKLGEKRDVLFYRYSLYGSEGFEGLLCSMLDVTDLRRFEKALHQH